MNSVAAGDGTGTVEGLAHYYALRAPAGRLFGQRSRRSGRRSRSGSRLAGERGGPLQHARRVQRSGERRARRIEARARLGCPVAGFDLTFSISKSISVMWALGDDETRSVIEKCHRQAIEFVISTRNARCSARVLDERDRFRRRDRCRRGVFPTSRAELTIASYTNMSSSGTERDRLGRQVEDADSRAIFRRRPRSQSSTRVSYRTF